MTYNVFGGTLDLAQSDRTANGDESHQLRLSRPSKDITACVIYVAFTVSFHYTLCSKNSDAKIQITLTTAYLTRIKYPLSGFNYHLFGVNFANFNKIHRTVSEQQLF